MVVKKMPCDHLAGTKSQGLEVHSALFIACSTDII